jgi:hypothetical protein
MCGICGCDAPELSPDKTAPELALAAPVKPATAATQTIALHQNLLHANNHQAAHNRAWFSRHRLSAINLQPRSRKNHPAGTDPDPQGQGAAIIGRLTARRNVPVILSGLYGIERTLAPVCGELLPRIC